MIKDSKGRTIIFDAFTRNEKLYLISTYYSISDSPITITLNGVPMLEGGCNENEPVRYFYCRAPTEATITIHINGAPHSITPERITPSSGELAVATLFKDDFARVADFVAYYRGQGCKKFYLYYNGSMLPDSLPRASDIVYRTWDYIYFNFRWNPIKILTEWRHCAQMTFLTAIHYRHMQDYTWFGLIDLDEWVHGPASILDILRTIANEHDVVKIKNHWAYRHNGVIYYNPQSSSNNIGSKCFYRNTFHGECRIHAPSGSCNITVSDTLKLIHMADDIADAGDSVPRQYRIDHVGTNPSTLLVADLLKT